MNRVKSKFKINWFSFGFIPSLERNDFQVHAPFNTTRKTEWSQVPKEETKGRDSSIKRDKRKNEQTNETTNKRNTNERTSKRNTNERTNKRNTNRRTNKQTKEQTNETQMNERDSSIKRDKKRFLVYFPYKRMLWQKKKERKNERKSYHRIVYFANLSMWFR